MKSEMGSTRNHTAPLAMRDALACAAATLVAYVGVVHEVVGAALYPDGPAKFGGPIAWYGVGLAGIAAGMLLAAGVLRLLPVPVEPLAVVVGIMGGAVFVAEAAVRTSANLVEINLATQEGDERLDRARELVELVRRVSRRVSEPAS